MSEKPLKVTGISSIQEDYYAALEERDREEAARVVERDERLRRIEEKLDQVLGRVSVLTGPEEILDLLEGSDG